MMTYRIKRIFNLFAVLCLLTGLGISSAHAAPSDQFVTTWKTDNPGSSNDTSITVPMVDGPYDVDWDNDGVLDEFWLSGPVTHDFGVAGTYTIRIEGSYSSIRFANAGDKQKIVSLDQWGTQTWTTMYRAFTGCSNLEIPATDTPDFSAVTDMFAMFQWAIAANPDTSGWDTSAVTNMANMFYRATAANPDTSGWDTSSVRNMLAMFREATSANPDTGGWDTSAVTNMAYLFYRAIAANPDTSRWNTSAVKNMSNMFYEAGLANPDTSGWDTAAVTNMSSMFLGTSVANPDTSGWDTAAVTNMSYMFRRARAANPNTSSWDTSAATDMSYMFYEAPLVNPDTSGWNTAAVTNMNYMFFDPGAANPDTSGWDTSAVTNMAYLFYRARSADPDTSGWDTSAVTNMAYMFAAASLANPDTSGWNTSAVTKMSYMFYSASLANPDTSGWDVSGVREMSYMFTRVKLSRSNYEALLINWNAQALQRGVRFDGGDSTYCSSPAANARASMINSDGWTITDGGQDCAETTPPPTVATSSASSVGTTAARLNGSADPNGASTNAWFQWGTSSSYGNTTTLNGVGSGTSPVSHSFNLSALSCGTTYHFRAVASNTGGTAYGSDRSFTTSACSTPRPTVTTSSANNIGQTAARLNGSADPNGASTSAWFQWGTSTAYGNATAAGNVSSGTSPVAYNFNLSTLACGTTYHFRAVAQNSGGTAYGSDRSFTTSACSAPRPTVVTSSASNIGQTAARLNGTADPNGASTSAWFQWGTSTGYGNVTAPQFNAGSGTSPVSYSFNLSTLACGTTYHFRAVAQNSGGTAYGSDRSFTTSACSTTPPPSMVTSPASSIGTSWAYLNGTADPNGASTSAWFQWGTSTGYGNTTALNSVGSGTSPVAYNFNLSTLACGTTYHFRAVAQNSGGTAYGSDRSFTTSACSTTPPPSMVTSPASSIGTSWAYLNGSADPNGVDTSAWFQWGTTNAYGNATAPSNVGSGTSPVSYLSALGGLQCGTTYHFRAVAENSSGTAYGSDRSFTTSGCSTPSQSPTVATSPASSISASGARLNGSADPNGASTSAWFQWGTSTAYGNTTSQTNVGSGTSPVSYNFNLSTLACGTTYHFRAVAQNSGGTAYGSGRSLTTSACATPPPTAVTSPASSIGETAARLNGSADPNGASTNAWFQWGTTTAYGNTTSQTNVGSGTSPVSYNFNLSTLACGTTYHFRAVAQNSGGTAYGSGRSLTTSACATPPPTAVTSPASSIGETAARLNGSADPNGDSTSAWFEWGTSTAYSNTTAPKSNVNSGTSAVVYSFDLGELACGTTYHFRAVAENSGGFAYGTDRSFTTSTCVTGPPQEEVIMETAYETATKEGWSSKGKVSIDGILAIDQYSLRHGKGAQSVYSVMTAGYEDVSVTMHLAATSLGSGDACLAEVSTDGGDSWMPVVTLQDGEDSGAFFSGTEFPPGADDNLDVKLRFRSSGKRNRGYCYGDEIYVMGTPIGG